MILRMSALGPPESKIKLSDWNASFLPANPGCSRGFAPKALARSLEHRSADPPTTLSHCRLDAIDDGARGKAAQ